MALNEIHDYSRACINVVMCLQSGQPAENITLPEAALNIMKDAIEVSDPTTARNIGSLIASLQIQRSRLNSLIKDRDAYTLGDKLDWAKAYDYSLASSVYDSAVIDYLAGALYTYGRAEFQTGMTAPEDGIRLVFRIYKVDAEDWDNLEFIIKRRATA